MNISQLAKTFVILLVLVLYSMRSWAGSWQQDVSASMSTEYETNPARTQTYSGSVWRALFNPGYTLTGNLGANTLKTGVALQMVRSSNPTLSINRNDPSAFLNWSHRGDAGRYGISSRYFETATRSTEINIPGSGIVDSTSASRRISGNWSNALSERSTLFADGAHEVVHYMGGNYIDYSSESASLMLNYALSETKSSSFQALGEKYIPTGGGPSTSILSTTAGLNWKAEYTDFSMRIGSYKSVSKTGLLGGVTMQYSGLRTQLALKVDRPISSSGLGGFVISDEVGGSWSYSLSDLSKAGIDLLWQKNQFLAGNLADYINITTGAWLQNDLNAFWRLRTYYQRRISEQIGIGGTAASNILGVTLIYNYTNLESGKE